MFESWMTTLKNKIKMRNEQYCGFGDEHNRGVFKSLYGIGLMSIGCESKFLMHICGTVGCNWDSWEDKLWRWHSEKLWVVT